MTGEGDASARSPGALRSVRRAAPTVEPRSGTAAAGRDDFIVALESLRGLAAVSVALFHCYAALEVGGKAIFERTLWQVGVSPTLLLRSITIPFNGTAAVSLFFVLSGFVLSLSLHRDRRPIVTASSSFAARRFLRIYPALAVNLLLIFGMGRLWFAAMPGIWFPHPTASQLLSNLLLQDFPLNGGTWTLLVEILAIPFLLLGHVVARKFGLAGIFVLVLVTIILPFSPRLALRTTFGGYVFLFALGMLVAELGRAGRLAGIVGRAKGGATASVLVLISARFLLGYRSSWSLVIEGLAGAALIAQLAYGPRLGLHRFLEARALRFVGRISYSYYLYHPLALAIVTALLDALLARASLHLSPLVGATIVAVVTTTAAIPLAWASQAVVERPVVRWGRRW